MTGNTQPQTGPDRPEVVTDEHLIYLDGLRESGAINMFGASEYIERRFDVSNADARNILVYWMNTYGRDTR